MVDRGASRPRPTLRRRAVVATPAVAPVLLVLAACSDDGAEPTPGEITPTSPPQSADDDLVARTLRRIARTRDQVAAIGTAAPAVAGDARALVRLHQAHGRELGGLPKRRRARVPDLDEAAARSRLDDLETTLASALVDAAVDSRSGALAQLFASMSAAIAQRTAA